MHKISGSKEGETDQKNYRIKLSLSCSLNLYIFYYFSSVFHSKLNTGINITFIPPPHSRADRIILCNQHLLISGPSKLSSDHFLSQSFYNIVLTFKSLYSCYLSKVGKNFWNGLLWIIPQTKSNWDNGDIYMWPIPKVTYTLKLIDI